ncbi:hypothetical protein ACE41H_21990 [Paenibacillus enshidis]|uniref:Uncharacterized protein n=1 Tax=Paenibacillus enshidis TaxID=1458439 RepID=A0ABV5AYY4_9BACL
MSSIYQSDVEFVYKSREIKLEECRITCETGTRPTIGDFSDKFKEYGVEVRLYDLYSMTFKPVDPLNTDIISIRVIRTFQIR